MVRLRAGESFPRREDRTVPIPLIVRGSFKKRARPPGPPLPPTGSVKKSSGSGSSRSAMPPIPPPVASRARPGSAAAGGVTVEDTDALDCGVCFQPLKAPIFQCNAGHVVCSLCRDKLLASGKCHVCGIATGGYSRCNALEHLVEPIRFPCPNSVYGCAAKMAYHDLEGHCQLCKHAPCHCPSEACNFVGSTKSLLKHFAAVHNWQCTTNIRLGSSTFCHIHLHDGFNFLLADRAINDQGVIVKASSQWLFLLNVVRQPFGRAISVLRFHSHTTSGDDQGPCLEEMKCELTYSRDRCHGNNDQFIWYYQNFTFKVGCTDLSDGRPSIDGGIQFVVLNSVIGDDEKDTIKVGVRISVC